MIAAHTGMTAFTVTTVAWYERPGDGLDAHPHNAFDDRRALAHETAGPG